MGLHAVLASQTAPYNNNMMVTAGPSTGSSQKVEDLTSLSSSSSTSTSATPNMQLPCHHHVTSTDDDDDDGDGNNNVIANSITKLQSQQPIPYSPPLEFGWVQHVSFPIFVVDIASSSKEYPIIAWNQTAATITQIDAADVLNQPLTSIAFFRMGIPSKFEETTTRMQSAESASTISCRLDEAARNLRHNSANEITLQNVIFISHGTNQTTDRGVSSTASEARNQGGQVSFRIKVSSQTNPRTNEISGLICLVEKEDPLLQHHQQQHGRIIPSEGEQSSVPTIDGERHSINHPIRMNGAVAQRQHQSVANIAPAEEYQLLIETANAPIFGVDQFGIVNEWNETMAVVTGISKEKAIGMPLLDDTLMMPIMQGPVESILQNAFRGRGTSNFELEVLTHNPHLRSTSRRHSMIGPMGAINHLVEGECSRFLLVNVTPRRNLQHDIVGAIAIAQDVTEACNHDRAVAAMANELRQLIDTANAPIFGIDRDGDVNEWNDKTAEITGYTKEEAFDCSLVDTFIVPDIQDSVQDVLDNALEGRGTSNYELEFRTKSNEVRHLLVNATPQRDMDNNIVGVVAIAQDVTEAVQRDRAVAGMALELRQLIDTANAPIFGIDIDGNVNEWNRRTSEITGYTKEEAFDEPLIETFIAPSMQDKVQEILDSALAGNETSNYELEFVSKSGEPIFLLVNATTRRDPENAVVGVVGVAQDVTEDRKHANTLREMQTLRASQEAKVETERNMTAYFAHELRNPLGAIDSALNAMPDDIPESARSLVAGMQLCTGFMSSIMNNLLDVRKMEEGKMQLSKAPVSLRRLLNNVHKMLLPSVRAGVEFRKVADVPKGKGWVLGDAHRIQQVMTNVVTNAIKYTVSGHIELFIGWEDGKVKFVCEDTGPGIPKSEQEKLFQRFVQRGGAPGTGLGLAIAKHLVDLTGGTIRFDSDPTIKAGTRCVVFMALPVCEAPESTVEESTSLIDYPISFLIIDDIKMNRMMLKRRIKKGIAPNSRIVEAATGEEALEICGKDKFDVIVVDQYMEEAGGVMVGTDVVFAMRRMRIDSVIIGCSGNDMGTQFKDAGADWVWQKPMPSNGKIIHDLRTSLGTRIKTD